MTISKILVAHDFSEPASRALRFAGELAKATGGKVALAYVHPDIYEGRGDPSLTLPAAMPGQGERYLRFLDDELKRIARQVLGDAADDLETHVVRGEPVQQIEKLAKELSADVICVGATGKGAVQRMLLGSVSQLVLRTSPVAVMIVP